MSRESEVIIEAIRIQFEVDLIAVPKMASWGSKNKAILLTPVLKCPILQHVYSLVQKVSKGSICDSRM